MAQLRGGAFMAVYYIRPAIQGELRDPFDCDEQVVNALVTVSAFVALADGRIDATERHEAVNYIDRQRLAPSISRQRIAEFFDARARQLAGRDFGDLITDALRPVAALSLTFDVVRIAELVAAADQHVDPNEARVIKLIRLITMMSPEPKLAGSPKSSASSFD
jgi:tellurite resistance protein